MKTAWYTYPMTLVFCVSLVTTGTTCVQHVYTVSVQASPAAVCAGGMSTISASVTCDGQPAPNIDVSFNLNAGPGSCTVTKTGTQTATFQSGDAGGGASITATAVGTSGDCLLHVIKILSTTQATRPNDKTRHTLGLGEEVQLNTDSAVEIESWTLDGGGRLTASTSTSVYLKAPQSPGTVTVHANLAGTTCDKQFTVYAPNAVTTDAFTNVPPWVSGSANIGFETWFSCHLQPNNVSFIYAHIREHIPAQTFYWPNGTAYVQPEVPNQSQSGVVSVNYGPNDNPNAYGDDVKDGLFSIEYLAQFGCSFNISVPLEYQDDNANWVSCVPNKHHPRYYVESGAARGGIHDANTVLGGWQGPWQ